MSNRFFVDHEFLEKMTAGDILAMKTVRRHFRRLLNSENVTRVYETMNEKWPREEFCTAALKALNVSVRMDASQMVSIPASGPTVVVSNHPFGAIEGIALIDLFTAIRPDVKVVANSMLKVFPDLSQHCLFVNPFDTAVARRENIAVVREALTWVKSGGMLVLFPAGEVSHFTFLTRRITDPVWRDTAAKIALKAEATVLPIYFGGRNTIRFQMAGMIHPLLRTAMLPSELFNKQGKVLNLQIGSAINKRKLKRFTSSKQLCNYLRTRTYALEGRIHNQRKPAPRHLAQDPIIPPIARDTLIREVASFSEDRCLVQHKQMSIYLIEYDDAPRMMMEIGRLREESFRNVDEGTGKAFDLDEYDRYYQHLILWDHAENRVAGAYRLGPVDRIVATYGFKGLYTHTLFKFSPKMKTRLSSALELGRSFVVPAYQRKPMSLALLWKGIGQFIRTNPQYRLLFGPVTISAAYTDASMAIIKEYFERQLDGAEGRRLIRPKNPVRLRRFGKWDMESVMQGLSCDDDLSTIIADLEEDAKGLPILVRQYLNLHGKILAFNLDESFSDGVDGLVVVDLLETPIEILRRFMGGADAGEFVAYHAETIQVAS